MHSQELDRRRGGGTKQFLARRENNNNQSSPLPEHLLKALSCVNQSVIFIKLGLNAGKYFLGTGVKLF